MTSPSYGPNGMISQTQTRRNQNLDPGPPGQHLSRSCRARTAWIIDSYLHTAVLLMALAMMIRLLACPIHTSLHL